MGNDKSISVSIPVNLTVAVSLITTAIVMFKFINEPFKEIEVSKEKIIRAQDDIRNAQNDIKSLREEISLIRNIEQNRRLR